jgi:hypothetical protein
MKVHELKSQLGSEVAESVQNFKDGLAHKETLKAFENCAICGQKLFFHHNVMKAEQLVEEHVNCIYCNERGPIRKFRMH